LYAVDQNRIYNIKLSLTELELPLRMLPA